MFAPIEMKRPEVFYAFGCLEAAGDLLPLAFFIITPYHKMKMRKCSVSGIATQSDYLPPFYRIAQINQHTVFLQMPVTTA